MKNKCFNILRNISLGKYSTKLYYGDKNGKYSTITGGIITLSAFLVLFVTAVNILVHTFKREDYTLTTLYTDL